MQQLLATETTLCELEQKAGLEQMLRGNRCSDCFLTFSSFAGRISAAGPACRSSAKVTGEVIYSSRLSRLSRLSNSQELSQVTAGANRGPGKTT